jgi:hypothetical protein
MDFLSFMQGLSRAFLRIWKAANGKLGFRTPRWRRLHRISHLQMGAQRGAIEYVKRLAGVESAVAAAPPPISGRAPRGSLAARSFGVM